MYSSMASIVNEVGLGMNYFLIKVKHLYTDAYY